MVRAWQRSWISGRTDCLNLSINTLKTANVFKVFSWCSWLSHPPNTRIVSGSNPDENNFFFCNWIKKECSHFITIRLFCFEEYFTKMAMLLVKLETFQQSLLLIFYPLECWRLFATKKQIWIRSNIKFWHISTKKALHSDYNTWWMHNLGLNH